MKVEYPGIWYIVYPTLFFACYYSSNPGCCLSSLWAVPVSLSCLLQFASIDCISLTFSVASAKFFFISSTTVRWCNHEHRGGPASLIEAGFIKIGKDIYFISILSLGKLCLSQREPHQLSESKNHRLFMSY